MDTTKTILKLESGNFKVDSIPPGDIPKRFVGAGRSGHITASRWELEQIFGDPVETELESYAEWFLQIEEGSHICIYDRAKTQNYLYEMTEQIDWNVGAFSMNALAPIWLISGIKKKLELFRGGVTSC